MRCVDEVANSKLLLTDYATTMIIEYLEEESGPP